MADFTWSYSSLKEYQQCPRKYHEIRVLKNYKTKEKCKAWKNKNTSKSFYNA